MDMERLLRRIRQHPALWGEHGRLQEQKAHRILMRCKQKLAPSWDARADQIRHAYGQRLLQTYA